MPRANWGIDASDVDEFDRSKQYKPYTGPIPPDAVYNWTIKVLKMAAKTKDKLPQLRIGLELEPRSDSEEKYAGFFAMDFAPVSEATRFRYVPFLDAIGVSGTDFTRKTLTDEEGNIKRIGQWRNTGEEVIAAQLKTDKDQDGKDRKTFGWYGEAVEDYDDDGTEDEDEELEDDEYDDDED